MIVDHDDAVARLGELVDELTARRRVTMREAIAIVLADPRNAQLSRALTARLMAKRVLH